MSRGHRRILQGAVQAVLWAALGVVPPALAQQGPKVNEACVQAAADHHGVNAQVLMALAWHESRLLTLAVGLNDDGSLDIGPFQINSVHLPELKRHGLSERDLLDPCRSAFVGAWHYARQVRRLGNSWEAIGAYHSHTPARQRGYANQIAQLLMARGVVPSGPLPFPPETSRAPGAHHSAGAPAPRVPQR